MEIVMKKTFAARHFECSQDLKEYSLESVNKLTKIFDRIVGVDIILQPSQDVAKPQQAEMLVQVPGDLLRTEVKAETYENAVHECIQILSRQIRKYKTKHFEH